MKTTQPRKTTSAWKFKVLIEPDTAKQMRYFTREVETECQWYTRIRREEDSETGVITFVLYGDILIPKQKVGDEDVDMDPIATMEMWTEQTKLLKEAGVPDDEVDKQINAMMNSAWNWCHSHVSMPAKPSETDRQQWKDWVKLHSQGGDPLSPPMMLILNKKDEVFLRVYDPTTRIQEDITDVEVLDANDPSLAYVIDAIANKLEPIEVKKPEPIQANPKYMDKKPQSKGSQQPLWGNGGRPGPQGGSMGLRDQLGKQWGGSGSGPQMGGRSFDSRPDYYAMLTSDDKKKIEWGLDTFHDGIKHSDDSRTNAGLKTIFRWIDSNLGTNAWAVIMVILETYLSLDYYDPSKLELLLETHDDPADPAPRFDPSQVLAELVDYDDDQVLELLDALLVLNADGKKNALALLEAFLASNEVVPVNSKNTSPQAPTEVVPATFRVLND